jgi:prepilin peptidase dependent protein B
MRQKGFTLMETMVALALSMMVTLAMVMLMGNSLGTTTRLLRMTQLTDQLRNAMRMMSRDVRRANYSLNAAYCYANSDCGSDGSANQFADIDVTDGSCFVFGLDRDFDGNASDDDAGGFRRAENGGIGSIEMWVGGNDPDCTASDDARWVPVTDPDIIDIASFVVSDSGSISASISGEGGSNITTRSREIQVQIEGRLIRDASIMRRIEDIISVRNDFISRS